MATLKDRLTTYGVKQLLSLITALSEGDLGRFFPLAKRMAPNAFTRFQVREAGLILERAWQRDFASRGFVPKVG